MKIKLRGGVGFLLTAIGGCLLASGVVVAQESKSLQDMLLVAIRMGDLRTVHQIVESGVDVARRSYNGKTAIDVAVELGKFDIAEYLVGERGRQEAHANAAVASARPDEAKAPVEILQPTPEAAPEVRVPAVVTPNPAVLPIAAAPANAPSMEQLLSAVAQLTSAVQILMQAQHAAPQQNRGLVAMPVSTGPTSMRVEPQQTDAPLALFAPLPGRKPDYTGPAVEQASLEPTIPASEIAPGSSTVLVTPRARLSDSAAARLNRHELDRQENEPFSPDAPSPSEPVTVSVAPIIPPIQPPTDTPPPGPRSAAKPAPAPVPSTAPASSAADGDNNGVFGSIKNFFGIGLSAPTPAPTVSQEAALGPTVEAAASRQMAYPADTDSTNSGEAALGALPADRPRRVTPAPQALAVAAPPQSAVVASVAAAGPPKSLDPAPPPVPPLPEASAQRANPTAAFERKRDPNVADSPGIQRRPMPSDDATVLDSIASAIGIGGDSDPKPPEKIPSQVPEKMPLFNLREPLVGTTLALGNRITGAPKLAPAPGDPDPCLRRPSPTTAFCVVPITWPREIEGAFSLSTFLYSGTRAIVRYDNGKASHYHTLFASEHYDAIIQFLTRRYGPPTDEWKRFVSPFDKPRQPNRTMVWRSRDSKTNAITIMEVREFDDTRNVFPDMTHGAVRLYTAGAPRIFPEVSQVDLMGIDWNARSDGGDAAPVAAAGRAAGTGVRR